MIKTIAFTVYPVRDLAQVRRFMDWESTLKTYSLLMSFPLSQGTEKK